MNHPRSIAFRDPEISHLRPCHFPAISHRIVTDKTIVSQNNEHIYSSDQWETTGGSAFGTQDVGVSPATQTPVAEAPLSQYTDLGILLSRLDDESSGSRYEVFSPFSR